MLKTIGFLQPPKQYHVQKFYKHNNFLWFDPCWVYENCSLVEFNNNWLLSLIIQQGLKFKSMQIIFLNTFMCRLEKSTNNFKHRSSNNFIFPTNLLNWLGIVKKVVILSTKEQRLPILLATAQSAVPAFPDWDIKTA